MAPPSLDVFKYLDYRAFLRDYYVERKAHGRSFSYRAFSMRAGLRSPNYLKLVMDGERNLTRTMAARFARACGLEGERGMFFQDLVELNQAKSESERQACFARLAGSMRYRSLHKLELAPLTLRLSRDGVALLKQRIQRFRHELLELSERDDDPVQVVRIDFEAFPLSLGGDRERSP